MVINTTADKGQEVFTLNSNKVIKTKVSGIKIVVEKDDEKIEYNLEGIPSLVPEDNVFLSKEDLLKSL